MTEIHTHKDCMFETMADSAGERHAHTVYYNICQVWSYRTEPQNSTESRRARSNLTVPSEREREEETDFVVTAWLFLMGQETEQQQLPAKFRWQELLFIRPKVDWSFIEGFALLLTDDRENNNSQGPWRHFGGNSPSAQTNKLACI